MLGSGAIVVCDDTTCMLDMALNAVKFYRNESCGKCVPCRMGSQKMVEILTRWTHGGISESQFAADLKLVDDLSAAMSQTSICGLGQIVPAPVQSVLKHFRPEVEAHVMKGQCPSGICFLRCKSPGGIAACGNPAMSAAGMIELTIDGKTVQVPPGTTVFDAARMNGITIPTLCHLQSQTPVGVCPPLRRGYRARVLGAACVRPVEPNMKVQDEFGKSPRRPEDPSGTFNVRSPLALRAPGKSGDCELETLAKEAGVGTPRFPRRTISRCHDEFFARHRRRSRRLHPV